MQIKTIDKQIYQTRSRKSYLGISAILIISSLLWSTIFIALFSTSDDNFRYNLLGVVTAVICLIPIITYCKSKTWFAEVMYVWHLKQELNKINRKMVKLQKAASKGEVEALTAIKFSYIGSRQIWELDDNTLMLSELSLAEQKLDVLIDKFNVSIEPAQYQSNDLMKY
ncbi:DUF3087 domain-containing protein [Agarivorans sp. TSD2052]|uniref:DUF3087 family protein n=1 Tax=Agarivorans sp. TSD2052 TaxID=2937286 RepID=UPI00200F5425|nr:DUF3087 family protein [Agarivorans sp. TSD2052]UPW20462.1 DUF3087 domain-containing protein [Agarivorans sp. TSD2052]